MTSGKSAILAGGLALACAPAPSSPEPAESASSTRPTEQAAVVAASKEEKKQAVIAVIQTREHRLAIHSGEAGPRFSVALQDGRVIARELDEHALSERYTNLFEIYRSGYASGGPYLDARRDPPARPVTDLRLDP